ncbi:MAG: hypothetical protein QM608_01905, partial [Caulobacter sp.]
MFSLFKRSVGLLIGAALLAIAPTGVLARVPVDRHVFSIEDALRRSKVRSAAIAPDGAGVAVQVTRPMADPGLHAGAARSSVQPRGDIWTAPRPREGPDRPSDASPEPRLRL